MFVVWFWLFIRLTETYDAHSGYDFPWQPWKLLPFQGGADRHDFHHSHNVGNYGAFFTFWDWIGGTDLAYRKWKQEQAAAAAESNAGDSKNSKKKA